MEDSHDGRDPFGIYGNISRTVEKDSYCFYGNNQRALSPSDFMKPVRKNDVLVIGQNADEALSQVALIVSEDLIRFFSTIDQELRDYHASSQWAKLAYAEFFIWWYHFLYTQVTNDLGKSGELVIPEGGMCPYVLKGGL
jgi:hypothetical protein